MNLRTAVQVVVKGAQDGIGVRAEFVEEWTYESIRLLNQRRQHMLQSTS